MICGCYHCLTITAFGADHLPDGVQDRAGDDMGLNLREIEGCDVGLVVCHQQKAKMHSLDMAKCAC